MSRTAIIGGGAAGCFCAIELKRRLPGMEVRVIEAGPKVLAKVAVTGGGRCNLTNSFADVGRMEEIYPRGARVMSRAFRSLDNFAVMEWFEHHGVALSVQDDNCVFPLSQDAMQIVHTLESLMRRGGVSVKLNCRVTSISPAEKGYRIEFNGGSENFDNVVVTSGGGAISFLKPLELAIEKPIPSLFTLKLDDDKLKSLMGTVVKQVSLSVAGTKLRSEGIVLITDWGVSGPATLKLSAYAARYLEEHGYAGSLLINWSDSDEASIRQWLTETAAGNPAKRVSGIYPSKFTARLWKHLVARAGIRENMSWAELGSKGINRLTAVLTADCYGITGRCRFKEEFVTCGGVALSNIDMNTLESKKHPGLFFAGEVLDIDAITGGFNLQAAWSTAYVAAKSLASKHPIQAI